MNVCQVEECAKLACRRGWCEMHYTRWHRYGDPQVVAWAKAAGTATERFWPKVDRTGGPDDCWLWKARRLPSGYGMLRGDEGRDVYAHRFSWEIHSGQAIPDGWVICHKCDNPPCVNPAHLFLGTVLDNNRDCIAKGRSRWQRDRIKESP